MNIYINNPCFIVIKGNVIMPKCGAPCSTKNTKCKRPVKVSGTRCPIHTELTVVQSAGAGNPRHKKDEFKLPPWDTYFGQDKINPNIVIMPWNSEEAIYDSPIALSNAQLCGKNYPETFIIYIGEPAQEYIINLKTFTMKLYSSTGEPLSVRTRSIAIFIVDLQEKKILDKYFSSEANEYLDITDEQYKQLLSQSKKQLHTTPLWINCAADNIYKTLNIICQNKELVMYVLPFDEHEYAFCHATKVHEIQKEVNTSSIVGSNAIEYQINFECLWQTNWDNEWRRSIALIVINKNTNEVVNSWIPINPLSDKHTRFFQKSDEQMTKYSQRWMTLKQHGISGLISRHKRPAIRLPCLKDINSKLEQIASIILDPEYQIEDSKACIKIIQKKHNVWVESIHSDLILKMLQEQIKTETKVINKETGKEPLPESIDLEQMVIKYQCNSYLSFGIWYGTSNDYHIITYKKVWTSKELLESIPKIVYNFSDKCAILGEHKLYRNLLLPAIAWDIEPTPLSKALAKEPRQTLLQEGKGEPTCTFGLHVTSLKTCLKILESGGFQIRLPTRGNIDLDGNFYGHLLGAAVYFNTPYAFESGIYKYSEKEDIKEQNGWRYGIYVKIHHTTEGLQPLDNRNQNNSNLRYAVDDGFNIGVDDANERFAVFGRELGILVEMLQLVAIPDLDIVSSDD